MAQYFGSQLWSEDCCLLTTLAAQLLSCHGDHLDQIAVILPTGRLASLLLAQLSKGQGAFFIPPPIFTLDTFIAACSNELNPDDDAAPLSQGTAELLLSSILHEQRFRHFHSGHERELLRLFAEIDEYSLGDGVFARLDAFALEEDQRSPARSAYLRERFGELQQIYGQFSACLQTAERVLASTLAAQKNAALCRAFVSPEAPVLPWQRIYCACFTTVKALYLPFLRLLGQQGKMHFFLSRPPREVFSVQNPLAQLIAALELDSARECISSAGAFTPERRCSIQRFSSRIEEVAWAVKEAERLIAEEGCPPAEIALLITNEAHYGSIVRALVRRSGITANIALAASLAESSIGGWLRALLRFLGEGEDLAALLAWLEHPLSLSALDLGERSSVRALFFPSLRKGYSVSAALKVCEDNATPLPPGLQEFLTASTSLRRLAKNKGEPARPLAWWQNELAALVTTIFSRHENAEDVLDAPLPQQALLPLWQDLHEAARLRPYLLSRGGFFALVQKMLARGSSRGVGFPLKGLQIISLSESRYVPFRHVFVLGCLEGNFPKALPGDRVLENRLREKIGLPSWSYVEALEDTTFQLLRARIPHLTLCYPTFVDGSPSVRSRFIEQLERGAGIVSSDHGAGEYSGQFFVSPLHHASAPRRLSAAETGDFQGARADLFAMTSATELEKLLHCPYQFLLSSLGIKVLEIEGDTFDPRKEGELLHRVVEAFFSGRGDGGIFLLPALSPEDIAEAAASALLARLERLSALLIPEQLQHTPFFYHLLHFSWPRFIAHVHSHFPPDARPGTLPERVLNEWKFGAAPLPLVPKIRLQIGDEEISVGIRGSIDRLDRGEHFYRITDYKRRMLPTGGEVARADAPQLVLYALALSHLPGEWGEEFALARARLGYWSLLQGQSGPPLSSLSRAAAQLEERWKGRLTALLLTPGAFFAPEPGKRCTHCVYAGICRKDEFS